MPKTIFLTELQKPKAKYPRGRVKLMIFCVGVSLFIVLIRMASLNTTNILWTCNIYKSVVSTSCFTDNSSIGGLKGIFYKASNVDTKLTADKVKRILLWTQFYYHEGSEAFCLGKEGLKRQREMCDYQCEFTTDRNLIDSSHAVVFHGRDLKSETVLERHVPLDMPDDTTRISSQPWIFLMLESPSHAWIDLSIFDNVFNWTMTYRADSDIYIPYGKIEKLLTKDSKKISPTTTKKTKLIAWINSNCEFQASHRNELVGKLKKYVQIDVYGKCGNMKCSKSNSNLCEDLLSCYEEIGGKYKFYLAFENSLCEDYITEKAFNALRAGMVPIVYGHANYSNYLPRDSFINFMDFKSIPEFVTYLRHLHTHPKEYQKYFQWKQSHVVVEDALYLERAWCSLCEKVSRLKEDHFENSVVAQLSTWWNNRNGYNVCRSTPSKIFSL